MAGAEHGVARWHLAREVKVVDDDIEVVELELPGGRTMLARVRRLSGGPEDIGLKQTLSLDGLTDTLSGIGTAVQQAWSTVHPHKAAVEFGLDLTMKGGRLLAMMVDGETKASLKVSLEWHNC
jgi:uncharacterized protein YoxC